MLSKRALRAAAGLCLAAVPISTVPAQTLTTVYQFTGAADGSFPSSLTADVAGTLYGTTRRGIFALSPGASTPATIAQFAPGVLGGSPITVGPAGVLYTTVVDTTAPRLPSEVLKFDPSTGVQTVLHEFGYDKALEGPVTVSATGDVYSSLFRGPAPEPRDGDIFRLDPARGRLVGLYSFHGANDGGQPGGGLVLDSTGELYGSTMYGGDAVGAGRGALFKIDPTLSHYVKLWTFHQDGGVHPPGGLVFGKDGDLYGATLGSPARARHPARYQFGSIFQFDPIKQKLTTLYAFTGGADWQGPNGFLVFGAQGKLYGSTGLYYVGPSDIVGTVFALDPKTRVLTTVHTFHSKAGEGAPTAGLTPSPDGSLYGTTIFGGTGCSGQGCGTIFRVVP